jgi:hypothetical protein
MQEFLVELARRVKRHPQSYPTWFSQLAEDVLMVDRHIKYSRPEPEEQGELTLARRFLSGE